VVDVGRALNEYFVGRAPWTEVKPYVECVFPLAKEVRPASAGAKYAR
jgi:hypothetical protein